MILADQVFRRHLRSRSYRSWLYQRRQFELIAELLLIPHRHSEAELAHFSRDRLISLCLSWNELLLIEAVNCPACWAKPNQPCQRMALRPGATPTLRLPRMHHRERHKRAVQKIGC